ncbi:hypothetical protein ABZV78_28755 [Micromonospora sp. NPDC004540]|uniref:hypothetical protein n=1 Tax=Micromonospora sp. NPDC004540 TaxID=3154457 RepID=UPI00339E5A32
MEILATRLGTDVPEELAELGETVAALAAKTDVKARLGGKATSAADGLRQRLTTASRSAKTSATQRFRTVSQKPPSGP